MPGVPEDAGEYSEGLQAILDRIPEMWGKYISCSKGWYPILIELDKNLAILNPDYEIHQVKEKFGGLRYYTNFSYREDEKAINFINEAEAKSFETCEICGEPGLARTTNNWIHTNCDFHADPDNRPRRW